MSLPPRPAPPSFNTTFMQSKSCQFPPLNISWVTYSLLAQDCGTSCLDYLSLESLTWSPDDGIAPPNSARRIFLCTSEKVTLMLKSYQQIPTIYRKRQYYFAGHGSLLVLQDFPIFFSFITWPFPIWSWHYMNTKSRAFFSLLLIFMFWSMACGRIFCSLCISRFTSPHLHFSSKLGLLPLSGIWGFPSTLEFQFWYIDDIHPCVCFPPLLSVGLHSLKAERALFFLLSPTSRTVPGV